MTHLLDLCLILVMTLFIFRGKKHKFN